MARGSKRQGENLQYFDCKLILPKKGEPINEGNCSFHMKTRVEINPVDGTVKRNSQLPPVIRYVNKELKESPSAIPSLRSKTWDYVANESFLSGVCVKISTDSYEHNGETTPTFSILLKDTKEKELYDLDFRFNSVTSSFLNSLTGLKWEDENGAVAHKLSISIATRKTPNGERPTLYLRSESPYNDQSDLVSWRFKKNENTGVWEDDNGIGLPQVEKHEVGNKTIYDTSALTTFYIEELNRIGKILEGLKINDEGELVESSTSTSETSPNQEMTEAEMGADTSSPEPTFSDTGEDDDDLPF